MDSFVESLLFEMKQISLQLKVRDCEYVDAVSICKAEGVDMCVKLCEELIKECDL